MTRYTAPLALLPGGWAKDVLLTVDAGGGIQEVREGAAPSSHLPPPEPLPGPVIPGVVNAHSHAFQRALAGSAEARIEGKDSFWSWRRAMYRFLRELDPEALEIIAEQLFVEMLEAGYTHVVEFHYLHRDPSGDPYSDPLEMARRIHAAAERAGLGLTLLPVLYQSGGFGGTPPEPEQRRFLQGTRDFLDMVEALAEWESPTFRRGFALHSLRAVPPDAMAAVLGVLGDGPLPRHIHVAEQPREVEASLAWSGQRPLAWLMDHAGVDRRWGLVHCTHLDRDEARALAASGAAAVVCPTTEANLGDGVFGLEGHLDGGGALAIGSDSHASVSPVEELRWLEYGQRLVTGRRSVAASPGMASPARRLLDAVWKGGAAASGTDTGALRPGCRADWLVLDPDHPVLAGRHGDDVLDAWIFSGNTPAVKEVWVAGRRVVEGGLHPRRREVREAFRHMMARLAS